MPLYEYACAKCEHRFEELIFGPADQPTACPKCGANRVSRGFGAPAAPQMKASLPAPGPCRSNGPPCGSGCSRFSDN